MSIAFDMLIGATVAIGLFGWVAALLRCIVVSLHD